MATQLNLNFLGDTFLPDRNYEGFVVSCRTVDGKKAIGLDCHFGFDSKDELKKLGAKWDSSERVWYFVFNTPDALRLMVAKIQEVLDACVDFEDRKLAMSLGYESGIYAENIVVPALRKICRLNSEI